MHTQLIGNMKIKGLANKILYFNTIMAILLILSSIYVGNFISTQIDDIQGFHGQNATIPYVESYGLTISISHIFYDYSENHIIVNLGPLPTTIPNYPLILLLVTLLVNGYFVVKIRRNKD
jgi:hypothetical protein